MSLTNDELYDVLIEQLRDLTTRHVVGQSRQRNAKLHETLHLLDKYEAGRNITLAKLAYDGSVELRNVDALARIRHHLHGEPTVFCSYYFGGLSWTVTSLTIEPGHIMTRWEVRNATRS